VTAASTVPHGRRVIVTGAAGGIGRAIVEALAGAGCSVGACDLASPAELFEDEAAVAASAGFDLRDRDGVQRGIRELVDGLGGCDAVVANAGVVDTIHRAERFSHEDWQRDIETNLSGQFHVIQAAYPALVQRRDPAVVVISSGAAESGLPGQVAYSASKAGLVGMARTLAAEWAGKGLRCNVIMPGMIRTPKVAALPEALQARLIEGIPLRRFGAPEELAGTVAFLLSPAAAYITGAILHVDGGSRLSTAALV
jgi:NAD(P)-dependent dehydrogenase (short-subunit alcohol dehydrogenase family)